MMGAGIQHTNQPVRGDPMPGSAVMMSCRGIVSRSPVLDGNGGQQHRHIHSTGIGPGGAGCPWTWTAAAEQHRTTRCRPVRLPPLNRASAALPCTRPLHLTLTLPPVSSPTCVCGAAGAAFEYGTAGFRTHASRLLPVAFRVGALAAARSVACGGGATGVVVTVRPGDGNSTPPAHSAENPRHPASPTRLPCHRPATTRRRITA